MFRNTNIHNPFYFFKKSLNHFKLNYDTQEIRLNNKSEKINVLLESEKENELLQSEMGSATVSVIVGRIASNPEEKIEEKSTKIFTKGTVTDYEGLPLPGANVIIKGTSTGTQTDFDGNYSIETKPGDVLTFSYVGYDTKEITVSNISTKIDVNLDPGVVLGEVVVVAGGISYEDYQPSKDTDWYEKSKQAYKNTVAFMKIKQEQKKAERKAKRGNE